MNETPYRPWSSEQRRVYLDLAQAYEAFLSARHDLGQHKGGMTWKRTGGREYLFRLSGRRGYGRSLGPRSADTEATYEAFHRRKQALKERSTRLRETIKRLAGYARAARLARVPEPVAAILRELDRRQLLGHGLEVVGTHALYAYEAMAGVRVESSALTAQDLDLRVRLQVVDEPRAKDMLDALRAVDPKFEPSQPGGFRASNADALHVEFIRPQERGESRRQRPARVADRDITATSIGSQKGLVSVSQPSMVVVVVADNGYPARMSVPDPRVFALDKLHTSENPACDQVKQTRDREQALLVARLVVDFFHDRPFTKEALRMLPAPLRERRDELIPSGFDL